VSFPPDKAMKGVVTNFKRWVATKAKVKWQRDFFDHRLRGGEGFDEKAHYVRQNPVRAGLVDKASNWKFVWMPDWSQRAVVR
jgi:hypothetical protein